MFSAPLATPRQVLTPAIQPFAITSAFDGGACPAGGVPLFGPGVAAGTLNNSTGSSSHLDLEVHQSAKIAVRGCPKRKKAKAGKHRKTSTHRNGSK